MYKPYIVPISALWANKGRVHHARMSLRVWAPNPTGAREVALYARTHIDDNTTTKFPEGSIKVGNIRLGEWAYKGKLSAICKIHNMTRSELRKATKTCAHIR